MRYLSSILLATVLMAPAAATAAPIVIDFDTLDDLEEVATQLPDLTFGNAVVVTAGSSLNEFEFPPHSGTQAVIDSGAPMTIAFASPFTSVGGFFTYRAPLTLEFFDAGLQSLAIVSSAFSSNLALSGDAGSAANEFLSITSPGGISFLTITGAADGFSFVLDDLTLTTDLAPQPVPEPSTLLLVLGGGVVMARLRKGPRRR